MSAIGTKLDGNQVLKQAYDDATNRIRVDAEVSATLGEVEVEISAADGDNIAISDGVDSLIINPDGSLNANITNEITLDIDAASGDNIAISDGDDTLAINPDGSINVVLSATSGQTTISTFDEVTSVASGVLTTITSYTVTSDGRLKQVDVSGTNIAKYEIVINGVIQDRQYTTFNNLNTSFNYEEGLDVLMGDVVLTRVLHDRPDLGDFNARIQVTES